MKFFMSKQIVSLGMGLAIFTCSFSSWGFTVLKEMTIQLVSADYSLDMSQMEAILSLRCTYKSGWFFPRTKVCGEYKQDLDINTNGEIEIPEIKGFDGWRKLDNYDLNINVYHTGERVLLIGGSGKTMIKSLSGLKDVITFMRVSGAKVDVTYEGSAFFGSDLTKLDRAAFSFVTRIKSQSSREKPIYLFSKLNGRITAFENLDSYAGKVLLSDVTELKLSDSYIAFFGNEIPELEVTADYTQFSNSTRKSIYKYKASLPLTTHVLRDIVSIDMTLKD